MIAKSLILPSILILSVTACDSSNEGISATLKESGRHSIEVSGQFDATNQMDSNIPTEGQVLADSGATEATFDVIGLEYSTPKPLNLTKEKEYYSSIRELIGQELVVDKIVYSFGKPSGVVEEGGVFMKPHPTFMLESEGDSNTGEFAIGDSFTVIEIQDSLAICNEKSYCSEI